MTSRLAAAGAAFAAALVVLMGPASPAWAHDQLVASDPEAGSAVSALDQVTLTFNAALLTQGESPANLAEVTGPDGLHYETGCAITADAVLTVPVALGAAGEYTVTWRVVSSDGHPVSDAYAFTYAPEGGTDAAAGAAASPCGAISGETASAEPSATPTTTGPAETTEETTPTPVAAPDGDDGGLAIGLGAGAAALTVLGIVAIALVATRKRSSGSG